MASRTGVLLLALVAALLCLQIISVQAADHVADVEATRTIGIDVVSGDDEVSGAVDLIVSDVNITSLESTFEVQPYEYIPDATDLDDVSSDQSDISAVGDGTHQGFTPAGTNPRPLARILHERSSKECYNTRKCYSFYKTPGCCLRLCRDLKSDNRHCGRCNTCCDTRKGYVCCDGQCRKPTPPKPQCGPQLKRCSGGKDCCGGKCVDLGEDGSNCGKCGKECAWGRACCDGKCKDLRFDCKNCGRCGRTCRHGSVCCSGQCRDLEHDRNHCGECGFKCGWGRECCSGQCVNLRRNKKHCGECDNKCVKSNCKYGMCGYGIK